MTQARWRVLRALVFAVSAVLIGALGFAAASDGSLPEPWLLGLLVALIAPCAWAFTRTQRRWWSLAAGMGAVQGVVYLSSLAAASQAGPVGCTQRIDALGACDSTWAVVAIHATAILLGVLALVAVERLAWRVVNSVVALVLGVWFAARISSAAPAFAFVDGVASRVHTSWIAGTHGMRGPPLGCRG